jgi:phosphoglycolate phosphatase
MAAIIFDFDGTLADSFDYVADFLAKEAGINKLSDEQRHELRGLSINGMVRRLGYHWWDAPRLYFKGQRRMRHAIRHLDSFEGMTQLLSKLHAEGHELFILSTNSLRNIRHFLHVKKIHKCFLEIYGSVGMFGKSPALRQLLKEQNLDAKQVFYVCDEQRDIEAARAAGIRSVAVSWGFADKDELKAAKPTAMADTPAELMRILEEV